jgi:hypothetical protein
MDYFATPEHVVSQMIAAVRGTSFDVVIDPAAGDGRLIAAALDRWPAARGVAVELDAARAEALREKHPDWAVHQRDFLELGLEPLGVLPHRRVLLLLNPPFSGKGAKRWASAVNGETVITAGRAMAFLVAASRYVAETGGELVALVPRGLLTNERDAAGRAALSRTGVFQEVSHGQRYEFDDAATRTAIVRWRPELQFVDRPSPPRPEIPREGMAAAVHRGALPVYKARLLESSAAGAVPFLHTTSIRAPIGPAPALLITPRACERIIREPCVLVPRVGAPDKGKVVIYDGPPMVMSDCLYAVTPTDRWSTAAILGAVQESWELLSALYGGSCAPFLRLADLQAFVSEIVLPLAARRTPDGTAVGQPNLRLDDTSMVGSSGAGGTRRPLAAGRPATD